jgi:hypothetical protein
MGNCPNCDYILEVDTENKQYCQRCEYYVHKTLHAMSFFPGKDVSLFKEIFAKWGAEAQILMMAEEASELSVATLHLLRAAKQQTALENFAEELADAKFMIEQMEYMFPEIKPKISEFRKLKEEKVKEMLKK